MGSPGTAGRVEYNRDVRPILSARCFACHGPDANQRKARLRLDQAEDGPGVRGGRRVIAAGRPERSPLLGRITHANTSLRMPPADKGKPLSSGEVAVLRRWIGQGGAYEKHWAYLPPRRHIAPSVRAGGWPKSDADRFLLARIEAAGLIPAPEADPITLLRRLSFDLTGLPPTPDEVAALAADRRPDAWERQVDRLLASPRYAERMATFWLDLVRYADTVGYHGDQEHAIYPFRDYVIQAFRDNVPFDRFTTEQLAGDLLPNPTLNQRIATGYNRVLQTTHEGGAQDAEYRTKYMADRVRNLSGVWLGATVGCAECHDHKFDPIKQKDFYSFVAFFADIQERGTYGGPDATPAPRPPELTVLPPFEQEEAARLRAQLAREPDAASDPETAARRADLMRRLAAVEKRQARTMVTVATEPRTIRVLRRGDWMDDGGAVVAPGVPAILPALDTKGPRGTRLDLARWLTRPGHPLTARVFVNRIWQLLFGAGLCRSSDDFGAQGEWPTHPELLDTLAVQFVEQGWDVKRLIRSLVTTAAYRQSSQETAVLRSRDPENRLFARQARLRLPAEMIRDQALAASGLLVERLGGPAARPYQPDGYYALLNFPKRTYTADRGEQQYRRGVYMHWQRQYLHPMLRAFDAPSREECTVQRSQTNTPLAALALLNDPSFVETARALAARVLHDGLADDASRVAWMWRLVLSREPEPAEAAALLRLLEQERRRYRADPAAAAALVAVGQAPPPAATAAAELAAWTATGRVLLNLSETITRY